MYTAKKLREDIAELSARCEAILSTGELNDELRTELDAIQGSGEEGAADFKPGKLHKMQADLKRIEAVEKRTAELLKTRHGTQTPVQQGEGEEGEKPDLAKSKTTPFARCSEKSLPIPVQQQFRYGKLKAFKGPDAERQAYLSGCFFVAALTKDEKYISRCKEFGLDMTFRAALGESQNQLGGFLVPEETEQTIIDLRESYGVARQECMVTPMVAETKAVPRRTGGLTAYFVDENPSSGITESDKNWNQVKLVAKTIATLTRYSLQLSDDAIISIGDDLANEVAYAFARKEDDCLFLGDGTSTYGGIVGLISGTHAGSTVTAATGNTAFSTLDLADFESMVGLLPKFAEDGAKWYISKTGWAASMLRLIDAAGGNTWRDLANGKRELQFLGYPVVLAQNMNSTTGAQTSTSGLAYLANLRQGVTFGNRRGVSIFPSEHRYMEFNQIGFRGMQRFDINYHERGATSAPGSVIMLATPGS